MYFFIIHVIKLLYDLDCLDGPLIFFKEWFKRTFSVEKIIRMSFFVIDSVKKKSIYDFFHNLFCEKCVYEFCFHNLSCGLICLHLIWCYLMNRLSHKETNHARFNASTREPRMRTAPFVINHIFGVGCSSVHFVYKFISTS